ncbi:MAG: sulfatase [Christensenellales bacterium]|jgi:arylsulfatase A-like enzyme
MDQPNILFVFSDQHRSCDLGCYGNGELLTPNFDAFAQKAAVFKNCIANSPVCVPSRGSLLTGLMPSRHRAITNDLPIRTDCESIASVMNKNGYSTGYIGKWHLAGIPRDKPISAGERLGFSCWRAHNCHHDYNNAFYYDEENIRHDVKGYEPIAQTDLAVEFIRSNSGQPWGLTISYGTPHDPYMSAPDKYLDLYRNKRPALRENVPAVITRGMGGSLNRDEIEEFYRGYYAHITALDEQFGRLLQALESTGQMENTLIIYTSDHGDMLGSQGQTNKQWPYFESINVPLMVYCKGKTAAYMSDEIISLVDLPVSMLALAGMSFSAAVDGQDLSSLFTDENAAGAPYAYIMDLVPCHQAALRGSPEWRGIKTKKHTYARSFDGSFEVLFDDVNDEFQRNNIKEDQDIKEHLEQVLAGAASRYDEFLPWREFIIKHGYKDEWNKSQRHFNLPVLE